MVNARYVYLPLSEIHDITAITIQIMNVVRFPSTCKFVSKFQKTFVSAYRRPTTTPTFSFNHLFFNFSSDRVVLQTLWFPKSQYRNPPNHLSTFFRQLEHWMRISENSATVRQSRVVRNNKWRPSTISLCRFCSWSQYFFPR